MKEERQKNKDSLVKLKSVIKFYWRYEYHPMINSSFVFLSFLFILCSLFYSSHDL